MVCRCVAAGCSNTNKDGFSLLLFPKDANLRKKWADQVKRTRANWMPTDHSVLCSKHFEDSCFEDSTRLSEAMGMKKMKLRLKPNAVPTIFAKPPLLKRPLAEYQGSSTTTNPKNRRTAYEKRERQRVYNLRLILLHISLFISQVIESLMENSERECSSKEITLDADEMVLLLIPMNDTCYGILHRSMVRLMLACMLQLVTQVFKLEWDQKKLVYNNGCHVL